MNILFITPRFPYPPLKGDQVVAYHRIRCLSQQHNITLVTFSSADVKESHLAEMHKYCKVITVPFAISHAISGALCGLFRRPLQVGLFNQPQLVQTIQDLVSRAEFDIAHISMLRMAYLIDSVRLPVVFDFVDSMALNFTQISQALPFGPKRLLYWFESRMLKSYESRLAKRAKAVFVVSAIDARCIESNNVITVPNGVDTQHFVPTRQRCETPTIAFSGKMDYWPNVEAVLWFARVFPELRKIVPDVNFLVIGGGWDKRLTPLLQQPGISFTGFVDSLASVLASCHIAIAPMRCGSGMQNKVLEAMSCGIPVVLSTKAKGDIRINNRENAIVADTENEVIQVTSELLASPALRDEIGNAAREYVLRNHSWETMAERISKVHQNIANKEHPQHE